jgi:hypothetical protein
MTRSGRLFADDRASSAAEFAMVLPLLLILIFGLIDAGRFMWDSNRAEKATQMGARFAAVSDMAVSGLASYSFSVSDGIPQGDPVPTANFGSISCTSTGCGSCSGSVCSGLTFNATSFNRIADRMIQIYPAITRANVRITYRNVGLGFAGDPDNSDVSPLITVSLRTDNPVQFRPITTRIFNAAFNLPAYSASVTGEDLSGTVSN